LKGDAEGRRRRRYGLSSKEFTPAMVKAVFDNLKRAKPKNHFTVGINDDVSHTSLPVDDEFSTEPDKVVRAMFYGSARTARWARTRIPSRSSARTRTITRRAISSMTRRSPAAMTVSHLRFGPEPIRSTYLVSRANFVACHQPIFLERYDMLKPLVPGGTFLLNTPYSADEIWDQAADAGAGALIAKKAKFYVIDATKVARDSGMGGRINTIMQVCFFALSGVLPRDEAIEAIKYSIKKTYGKKGEEVVQMNLKAVDNTLAHLHEVPVPGNRSTAPARNCCRRWPNAPEICEGRAGQITAGEGDDLPVSAFPVDGTFPTGTAQYEKRNLALDIPVWDEKTCIQCGSAWPSARTRRSARRFMTGGALAGRARDVQEHRRARARVQGHEVHAAGRGRGLHRLRALRGRLPGQEQDRGQAQGHQHAPAGAVARAERDNWDFFLACRNSTGARSRSRSSASSSSCSRCSSSAARAPAAARRPTSRCSRSCSATAPSSPTPPAAPRFTAATCRPRLCEEQGRPRPDLVQFAVRGQRGVRPRLPRLD
jgi:Pyruvate/2-oxoacid:ferredoxin oxidoreductase gamma subunit